MRTRVLRIGDWNLIAIKPLGTLKRPLTEFSSKLAEPEYTWRLDVQIF